MLAVLGSLDVLLQLHLRIKQTVLVNVLLIFDFILIRQLGNGLLMLLFQFRYAGLVILLCLGLFLCTAGCYSLIIFIKICFNIPFRIGNQLVDLALVLGLHCLRLFQIGLQLFHPVILFLLGINVVFL